MHLRRKKKVSDVNKVSVKDFQDAGSDSDIEEVEEEQYDDDGNVVEEVEEAEDEVEEEEKPKPLKAPTLSVGEAIALQEFHLTKSLTYLNFIKQFIK